MKVRLLQIGLKPARARFRAFIHLVERLEAPILARILNLSPSTANRWSQLAGRTYGGYVGRAAQQGRTPR